MKKIPPYRNVSIPLWNQQLSEIDEIKDRHMVSRADVLRHAIAQGLKFIRNQESPFPKPPDRESHR
jgi:metal-responsive CopG/Arc/MetJ family transcriptional regulator